MPKETPLTNGFYAFVLLLQNLEFGSDTYKHVEAARDFARDLELKLAEAERERDTYAGSLEEHKSSLNAARRGLDELRAKLTTQTSATQAMEDALKEIEGIPAVPFTRDHFLMAKRTIDAMTKLASAALAKAKEAKCPP